MTEARERRKAARKEGQMCQLYEQFLREGKYERSPSTAHRFALAMKLRNLTFGRAVEQVIIALEGSLPHYWASPYETERRSRDVTLAKKEALDSATASRLK